MKARALWLKVHRWLALTLGVLLAVVALLGSALTVAKPLDRWANDALFRVGHSQPLQHGVLESVRSRLVAEFGTDAALTFRPPREAGESLWAVLHGRWHGTVYIDPVSGRELGRRAEDEGLYNLLFELHSALLLDDLGKPVLAAVAAAYLVLLVTGLVLWWPARWAQAWRVETRRGTRRLLFDLHRVGGSTLGLLVAVCVASGAYMAWRPLSHAVTALAGSEPTRPPSVPPVPGTARSSLDEGVRRARALFGEAMVGYVQIPASAAQPIRVRLKLDDDPHPNGLTSVWLHPVSGEVLRIDRWSSLDTGARAYTWVYPLHTGELGGTAHLIVNAVGGLVLAGFGGSGVWLWWRRRRGSMRPSGSRQGPQARQKTAM